MVSVSEPLIDGPFGSLIERIIEWMDEYYSIRLSGEVMRGMTQNAIRGHYQSDAPIGYRSPGNKKPPEKDPKTVQIPIMMKDLLLSGSSLLQIARKLNEQAIARNMEISGMPAACAMYWKIRFMPVSPGGTIRTEGDN